MNTDLQERTLPEHPLERFWSKQYPWLLEQGYQLRGRYNPDRKPTKDFWLTGEGRTSARSNVMDAIRVSDDRQVFMKHLDKKTSPREFDNIMYFSSETIASDPENFCVPVLELLKVPDEPDVVLIVFPLLRAINSPKFQTYSEALFCIRQMFVGLRFMHSHRVAHLDCQFYNIMMDARGIFPQGFHPSNEFVLLDYKTPAKARSRTLHPPRYYLIDLGESYRFSKEDISPQVNVGSFRTGDGSVPEFQLGDVPIDPFPVDVFTMGNIIRRVFLEGEKQAPRWTGYHHFDFLKPLVDKMMSEKPEDRPSMDEVVKELDSIIKGFSSWKLRSKIYTKRELRILGIFQEPIHLIRTLYYVSRGVPAFPSEPCTKRD